MAESNQRKFAEPIDLDDEDPFAELTRIMGFDPRVAAMGQPKENPAPAADEDVAQAAQTPAAMKIAPTVAAPVAPKAAEPAPAVASGPHDDFDRDDFGIDLEKELLGEFADADGPSDVEPPQAVESSAAPVEVASAAVGEAPAYEFEDELDDAFAALSDDLAKETNTGVEVSAAAQETAAGDARVDDAAGLDFDEVDFDRAFAQEASVEAPAATPEPAAEEPEPVIDLDLGDIELDEPMLEAVPAEQPAAPMAAASDGPLLDLNLDDIDFNETSKESVAVDESVALAEADERAESELAFDFSAIDLDETAEQPAALDHAAAEPVAARQPEPVVEDVLPHDGLAEVDMDFSAAFDREFAAGEPEESHAPQAAAAVPAGDDPVDIWDVQPAEQPDLQRAEPVELSLEAELDAVLSTAYDEPHEMQPAEIEPAPSPEPVSPLSYDSQWSTLEADDGHGPVEEDAAAAALLAETAVGGPRRPLSDPSLIARHASFRAPPQPTDEPDDPKDELDELLDAMEHEVHAGHSPAPVAPEHEPHGILGDTAPATHVEIDPALDNQGDRSAASGDVAQPFADEEEDAPAAPASSAAPEIDTVEVPETAVAIAHDLDIPELAYEEERPQASAYDDIDTDFAAAFQDNKPNEEPVNQIVRGVSQPAEREDIDDDFEAFFKPSYTEVGRPAAYEDTVVPFQPAAAGYRPEASRLQDHYSDLGISGQTADADQNRFVDFDFDPIPGSEEEPAEGMIPSIATEEGRRRNGLLIAGAIGGVALLGAVAALALSFGGGGAEAPAVVKADASPVKVKPENPGGAIVPNQDNKVYDAVKGTTAAAKEPTQEKLVTTAEEPVDMAAVAANDPLPGVDAGDDIIPIADGDIIPKAEDRIEPAADADPSDLVDEGVVVAPRKVKTMIVRADGTLVPREDPGPAADAAVAPAAPAGSDKTGTVAVENAAAGSAGDAVPVQPVKTSKVAAAGGAETAPEAPALPPAQNVKKADAPKTETVAAVEPQPTAAATGAWSVQIASQPSADSAKATYEDLARRYASVIGGRGVNIVKAEIAGKGTYWRVRIPANTRDEAAKLCGDYKAAGGNCFISK